MMGYEDIFKMNIYKLADYIFENQTQRKFTDTSHTVDAIKVFTYAKQ